MRSVVVGVSSAVAMACLFLFNSMPIGNFDQRGPALLVMMIAMGVMLWAAREDS